MANTPTTHASVASRLTDEEIERLARIAEDDGVLYAEDAGDTVAVLLDYVRLRKMANAIKAKVDAVNKMPSAPLYGGVENQKINGEKMCAKITAFAEITRLLAEAEKGEAK